jgi:hypothetical protein
VDADHRRNPRTLLRGYNRFRELHDADRACAFYLTSILADNIPARRFLEANLRGMPTYRFIGEFGTLIMRVRARRQVARSPNLLTARADEIACLLQRSGERLQFAAQWNEDKLVAPQGLGLSDFHVARDDIGRLAACAALWDQRKAKRTVVRGYAPLMARTRWIMNLMSTAAGRPRLPRIGQPIRAAYLSHMASDEHAPAQSLVDLVARVHMDAHARGLDYVIAGFPRNDPLLDAIRRRFGGRELLSRLYVVYWPDGKAAAQMIDLRQPVWPEVALL